MNKKRKVNVTVAVLVGAVVGLVVFFALMPLQGTVPVVEELEWVPAEPNAAVFEAYTRGGLPRSTVDNLSPIRILAEHGYEAYFLPTTEDVYVVETWIVRIGEELIVYQREVPTCLGLAPSGEVAVEGNVLRAPTTLHAPGVFTAALLGLIMWAVMAVIGYMGQIVVIIWCASKESEE